MFPGTSGKKMEYKYLVSFHLQSLHTKSMHFCLLLLRKAVSYIRHKGILVKDEQLVFTCTQKSIHSSLNQSKKKLSQQILVEAIQVFLSIPDHFYQYNKPEVRLVLVILKVFSRPMFKMKTKPAQFTLSQVAQRPAYCIRSQQLLLLSKLPRENAMIALV